MFAPLAAAHATYSLRLKRVVLLDVVTLAGLYVLRVLASGMAVSVPIPPDADRKGNLIRSNSDDVNHFHPDYFGKGKTWKDPKLDRVLANYALAREMFAADGREIVNATVGGRLDLFRRMPLAQALGEAARSSEPPASRFRAAASPPPRPGRPARRRAQPVARPGRSGRSMARRERRGRGGAGRAPAPRGGRAAVVTGPPFRLVRAGRRRLSAVAAECIRRGA